MKEVILIKLGEIVLKGLNRKNFEDKLIKSIKHRLHKIGAFKVKNSQSIITVTPVFDDIDMDEAAECISKIFGIAAFSRAVAAPKDIESIKQTACDYLEDTFAAAKSFFAGSLSRRKSASINFFAKTIPPGSHLFPILYFTTTPTAFQQSFLLHYVNVSNR